MSKKDQTEQQGANAIDEINDQLTGISRKVQENQRIIYISTGIVAFIVICVLVYIYAFRNPGIERGNNEIGLADLQLFQGNDSIALTQYESIANEHGYSAGNRAALQAAILLFEKGEYQQALDYLSKYSADEAFIGAAAYSLEGDCYVNLDQLDNAVKSFREKNISDGAPINAGYMVLEPGIFGYIDNDQTVFEREPLEKLAEEGELMSYMHHGFWQCMDTKREKDMLERYLSNGTAPWKKWKD